MPLLFVVFTVLVFVWKLVCVWPLSLFLIHYFQDIGFFYISFNRVHMVGNVGFVCVYWCYRVCGIFGRNDVFLFCCGSPLLHIGRVIWLLRLLPASGIVLPFLLILAWWWVSFPRNSMIVVLVETHT